MATVNPHAMQQAQGSGQGAAGVSNVTYDLLSMLHNALEALTAVETYLRDAQTANDREAEALITEWRDFTSQQAEQLRGMVATRLASSGG